MIYVYIRIHISISMYMYRYIDLDLDLDGYDCYFYVHFRLDRRFYHHRTVDQQVRVRHLAMDNTLSGGQERD